jgi:hypothetical protein
MFSGSPPKADFYLRVSKSAHWAGAPLCAGDTSWRRLTTCADAGATAAEHASPRTTRRLRRAPHAVLGFDHQDQLLERRHAQASSNCRRSSAAPAASSRKRPNIRRVGRSESCHKRL